MGRVTRTNFGWTVTRRLTNAEILTLFTNPITLIPARVGVIWFPFELTLISQTTAAAYATAANLLLGYPGKLNFESVSLADSQLDSADLGVFLLDVARDYSGTGDSLANIFVSANLPLIFSANANPTGGDPANYAIVKVEGITLETV